MLKKLLKDIFSQKGIYLLLLVGILNQLGIVSLPYFGKIYVDFIVAKDLNGDFYFYIYLGLFISFVAIILGSVREYLKKGITTRFEIEKNLYYFQKFFSLDFAYRNQEGTGKTITKINRGIEAQISLFNSLFELIIIFVVRITFLFFVMFTLFKPLIAMAIFIACVIFFVNKYISKSIKILTDEEQDITERIGRQSNKMIMESNLIHISNKTQFELEKLYNTYKVLPKLRQKIFIKNEIINNILHIFFQSLDLGLYVILGLLVIKSEMTLGEMTMIIAYVWRLWWPIEIVLRNISEYRNQISKYEALEKFVNQENKLQDGKKDFQIKSGEISFQNIDFGYTQEKNIFQNFSLKIQGGKKLALVGHSGSGKSTLIKLILRNYAPQKGNIQIDGQDVSDLKIATLYENIGYLSQEPAVFDGTIKENLMYAISNVGKQYFHSDKTTNNGNENIRSLQEEHIWNALKNVGLDELIKESKEGLDTEIGEKGLKLSGGEKQRLAIARIFLKNPKILILDEPTSALDSISENKITNIINKAMDNRTVIVIAHRLQTVMEADTIVVIEKGTIAETGTHSELLEQKGIYSSLVDLQRGVIHE